MRTYRFKQVDVFAEQPFRGNPVAVVLGAEGLADEEMQRIASWTNLSETTFVLPPTATDADYRLRIFDPKSEMRFAGHPTVGSAHAVIESGFAPPRDGRLRQECLAGLIDLRTEEEENGRLKIWVKAPPAAVTPVGEAGAELLRRALRASFVEETPPLRVDVGVVWVVVNMGDAERVASLDPDMALTALIDGELRADGVTVFGRAGDGVSALHVRSFAPAAGVPEDPVCGSGNISVAAFLAHAGLLEQFGPEYTARQGMQLGRDGRVSIRVGEGGSFIELGGHALTCIDGSLSL
jgi:PhzF family phenazine biosynthesis protein